MELEEKKQWLGRYRECDMRIMALEEDLQKWQERAQSVTKPLSDMPKGKNGKNSLEEAIGHIFDIGQEINETIMEAREIKEEIEKVIDEVDNGVYRTLLRLRYIHLKKWEWIAVEMNYDYRWILRLHIKALKKINTPHKAT